MAAFFIADTHFSHRNIITSRMARPRPFASIEAHDEMLIAAWNNWVRPDDTVWHLGDFAYGASAARCREVFSRLDGVKRLVWGNHDHDRTKSLGWASQHERVEVEVDDRPLVLSHYAQRTWHGMHRGALHLYGHSHGGLPGCGRSLDVGVDCWDWRPVTLDEILERMAEDASRGDGRLAVAALSEAA